MPLFNLFCEQLRTNSPNKYEERIFLMLTVKISEMNGRSLYMCMCTVITLNLYSEEFYIFHKNDIRILTRKVNLT